MDSAEQTDRRLRMHPYSATYYVGDRLEGHKPGDYAVCDLLDKMGPPRDVPAYRATKRALEVGMIIGAGIAALAFIALVIW